MKWIRAKVGTLPSQLILHTRGKIKLGSLIEWKERGETKWTKPHSGIIDKINDDGLIFIERM